ncbi:MAG: hypothetical protein ACYCX4_06145 [Bacillota bacterium]
MAQLEKLDMASLSQEQLKKLQEVERSLNQGENKKIFLMAMIQE